MLASYAPSKAGRSGPAAAELVERPVAPAIDRQAWRGRTLPLPIMGTLSSELGPVVGQLVEVPRVYADANIPSGVVAFMRTTLGWDVLFVLEHDDLRRAPDIHHYRLAHQLGRTLMTLDRDYIDDRRFPPDESPGVIVFSAPDERWLREFLAQADRQVLRPVGVQTRPLAGRKILWQMDTGERL